MSGVLFLAHRLPFPPDRGDKIRSFHVLTALAGLGPVHVGCFADDPADLMHEPLLADLAESHCLVRRAKPLVVAGAEALLRGEAVSLSAFRSRRLSRWVAATLASGAVDTVYLFSGQMGQFVPAEWRGRVIADLVDVDSAKFEAYARDTGVPVRWLHRREARLLQREEARIVARADRTLLVSEAEAQLLRSRAGHGSKIAALPNGVDAAAYDPAQVTPHPALAALPGPRLIFTGQMDYPPNVAAALRVVERLLPAIRARFPDASFHVVGRAPTAALRAHDGISGVRVWGEVPDVRPFLAGATVAIAPLEIARGVQNKVLEAMAMALPVVLSGEAATGIDAADGVHFAVGTDDAELIAHSIALLSDPQAGVRMGQAARRLVRETMDWPAALAGLPALLGRASPGPVRHAA